MRSPSRLTFLGVFAVLAVAGCKARPIPGSASDVVNVPTGDPSGGAGGPTETLLVTNCTPCHGNREFVPDAGRDAGDPLVAAAPPRDTNGHTVGGAVGAHRAHLVDGPLARAVECASCHLIPTQSYPHDAQRQGKVSFSRVATASVIGPRATPTWNGTSCSGTYCHGAFKNGANGGAGVTVAWDGGPVACGSCHAVSTVNGSGGTHPTGVGTNCSSCHGGVYTSTVADPALHVNGVVDLGNMDCSTCHGDNTRTPVASASALDVDSSPLVQASPPRDASGATVSAAVGAHLAHVNQGDARGAGPLSLAVSCVTCHPVPTSKAHASGAVDVAFTGVAVTGNLNPSFARATGCASTYCHGNFPGGAGAGAISWGGTAKLGCTDCHGAPPSAAAHHPPNPSCATCHAGYTGATVNVATHVDGQVQHQPAAGCTQCHGDVTANAVASGDVRAAPGGDAAALDAHGNPASATSARGVGAHAAHLTGTHWRATPIACGECHVVPVDGDVSHASAANATVTFGTLAKTAWSGPALTTVAWDGNATTCANTYCHGNFKNGANASPTWTAPGTVACGSCHGIAPPNGPGGNHPAIAADQDCSSCHGTGYSYKNGGSVDTAKHLNGVLDVPNMSCTSCHGDGARTAVAGAGTVLDVQGKALVLASPPQDTHGLTASPQVGAHLAHLNQGDTAAPGPLSSPIACVTCHTVPTSLGHSSGTAATVVLTGLNASASYAGGSCSATYCHGNFQGGNGPGAVSWSATGKLGCTDCHGAPPPVSAHHPQNGNCGSCHTGYTNGTVAVATHVDGQVQHTPAAGCTQCHGDLSVANAARTDVRVAPAGDTAAVDTHGNPATATSARGVGAHAAHLTGTLRWRAAPIACGECHVVPADGDVSHASAANATVTFGALAKTAWSGAQLTTLAWDGNASTCSNTYCHGNFKNGANATPTWAAPSPVACGSCHGFAPPNGPGGSHPPIPNQKDCDYCHGQGYSYVNLTVDKTKHMNGVLDGGGEPSTPGSSCGGCHGTIVNTMTMAKGSAGAPAFAHFLGSDQPGDTGAVWGNPLANVSVASRSCTSMCHGDHPHDATSPVSTTHEFNVYVDAVTSVSRGADASARIAAGGSGTQNRDDTDFRGTVASGGMCMSCHTKPVSAALPALTIAAFDASAHDFTFNTVGTTRLTWQYALHTGAGSFDRNCTKCHASAAEGTTPTVSADGSGNVSVHFGDNAFLLAGKKNPGGTAAGFVCYNCHGGAASPAAGVQGNRSGKNLQAMFDPALGHTYAHPVNADSTHDSVAEFAAASFGNALGRPAGAGQRHASCMDCHDTHEARAGTHAQGGANGNVAGPPLQGAWGVRFRGTLAAGAAPTDPNFLKTTIVAGTDLEATLCFKCHSAYYLDPASMPTAPGSLVRTPAYRETDQVREFNTANMSYHPVLAAVRADRATPDIKTPWTATSTMTCTDCHESDDPNDLHGPHGSAAPFLLKGPNTRWDPTLAISSVSGGVAMPDKTFCINCHDQRFTGSRAGAAHTRGEHRGNSNGAPMVCMSCHVRIPHGSGHRGLLVSKVAGNPGVDGGTVFSDSSPWSVSPRLIINSYPTGTLNWGETNCSCDSAGVHK